MRNLDGHGTCEIIRKKGMDTRLKKSLKRWAWIRDSINR